MPATQGPNRNVFDALGTNAVLPTGEPIEVQFNVVMHRYRGASRHCRPDTMRWRAQGRALVFIIGDEVMQVKEYPVDDQRGEIVSERYQRAVKKQAGRRTGLFHRDLEVASPHVFDLGVFPNAPSSSHFSLRFPPCRSRAPNWLTAYSIRLGWPKSAACIKRSVERPVVLGRFDVEGRFRCRVQQYDANGNALSDEHIYRGCPEILPKDVELIQSLSKSPADLPEVVSRMLKNRERRFYHLFYPYSGLDDTWK